MSLAEIHGILAQNRELITQTWNFFVTVHLAILGLVFIADHNRPPPLARFLIIPAYAAFMYINYRAQVDNYAYSTKILDYAAVIEAENVNAYASLSVIFETGWIMKYLPWIYSGAFGFGCVVVMSGFFLTTKSSKQIPIDSR